ncbi:ATP-NAD kinase-like domain-containing protein [Bisporella sp. PMI_857]|nr:ATP-NAD kinase-like domain-containing protein [Bisporella sp. PMI_857]
MESYPSYALHIPPILQIASEKVTNFILLLDPHISSLMARTTNSRRPTLYILISTLSGTQLAAEFCSSILRPVLQAIGLGQGSYTLVQTSSADSVKEFARDVLYTNATEGHAQTVIMLSGDGGTVDILNQLYTTNGQSRGSSYVMPLLCLFPLGTGNGLYHSIQRPHTLPSIYVQALRTFLHGEPVPLPAYRATFSPGSRLLSNQGQTQTKLVEDTLYGAVVISYGFHATLVAESDTAEYRKYGDKRFGMAAKALLLPDNGKSPPHAYRADVLVVSDNGRKTTVGETQRHGYVLASLVSNLEREFTISPKSSKRLDGKLRLVHFGDLDATGVNLIMTAAYQDGNHIHLPEVFNWGWRRCCIDGLIVGVEENGWMKVNTVKSGEEAVQVLLPPSLTG